MSNTPEPEDFTIYHDLLYDPDLTLTERHIALFLEAKAGNNIYQAHDCRMARYTNEELAKKAGCTTRTVQRAIVALSGKYVAGREGPDILLRANPTPIKGSSEVLYVRCPKWFLEYTGLKIWHKHLLLFFMSQGRKGEPVNTSHGQALKHCFIPGSGESTRTRKIRKFISVMVGSGVMIPIERATVRRPATHIIELTNLPGDRTATREDDSTATRGRQDGHQGGRQAEKSERRQDGHQGMTVRPPGDDSTATREGDRTDPLLSSSYSPASSFNPQPADQPRTPAADLVLATGCAGRGVDLRSTAGVRVVGPMDQNSSTSPQSREAEGPSSLSPSNPNPCQAEGPSPALLAACDGSEAHQPPPATEAKNEPRKGPYDLTKLRAPLAKDYQVKGQKVAPTPRPKAGTILARCLSDVESVEEFLTGDRWNQRTEMPLEKVARHLAKNRDDLPRDWIAADLREAFKSPDFNGSNRLSWGWAISEPVWERYVAAVRAAHAMRLELEEGWKDIHRRASEARASGDPLRRARVGALYSSIAVKRPEDGVPLLLEGLEHPESLDVAVKGLEEWSHLCASESPGAGDDGLVRRAVAGLSAFLAGRVGDTSDAVEIVRQALGDLESCLIRRSLPESVDEANEYADDLGLSALLSM